MKNNFNLGGIIFILGGMDLTNLDMEAVNEIQNYGPRIFKLLVNSLCPSIFGMNVVKVIDLVQRKATIIRVSP